MLVPSAQSAILVSPAATGAAGVFAVVVAADADPDAESNAGADAEVVAVARNLAAMLESLVSALAVFGRALAAADAALPKLVTSARTCLATPAHMQCHAEILKRVVQLFQAVHTSAFLQVAVCKVPAHSAAALFLDALALHAVSAHTGAEG